MCVGYLFSGKAQQKDRLTVSGDWAFVVRCAKTGWFVAVRLLTVNSVVVFLPQLCCSAGVSSFCGAANTKPVIVCPLF